MKKSFKIIIIGVLVLIAVVVIACFCTKGENNANVEDNELNIPLANVIVKTCRPSGFAGSSMQELRLYSNGEVYQVLFEGEEHNEENIIAKVLVANNVEDIEEKTTDGVFESVIVKVNEEDIFNKDISWIEFENK